jgi:hypothetical protein
VANVELWLYSGGVLATDGPITSVIAADIVLEELNQFSASSVTVPGSERRALLAMTPYTLVEVVQTDLAAGVNDRGTLAWGYVLRPEQQISENDDHTVTLTLEPITAELLWRTTRRGWVAQNWLSVIASRLATLAPGWTSTFTGTGSGANDLQVSVSRNQDTIQAAYLAVASQFGVYARLGRDPTTQAPSDVLGAPVRRLEMGIFGAAPTAWLTSANGASADSDAPPIENKLVATIQRIPNDAQSLVNVTVPFGGGSSTDTVVNLERLWRIINDPSYPNYGRFGTDAESMTRTGHPSVFPEYDHAHYPITDPDTPNPPTNTYDPDGNLLQGWYTTRATTLDGHWDYPVMDAVSYATYGFREGNLIDSTITYPPNTDGVTGPENAANQELVQRALYLAVVANFKRFSHPHHVFSCTVANATHRPTRAGDLIAVDVQRVSQDEDGAAVVELNVVENLKVMRVVRRFQGGTAIDEYTLSNLGRFDEDDTTAAVAQATQLVSFAVQQGTGLAKDSVVLAGNIDAMNPMTHQFYITTEHFRYHQVRVRCDFYAYRGTTTTAQNPTGTAIIAADVEVLIPTPVAIQAQSMPIGGAPPHFHKVPIANAGFNMNIASTPYNSKPDRYVTAGGDGNVNSDGTGGMQFEANGHGGSAKTGTEIFLPDLNPTSHTHPVKNAGETVAHIPAGQRIAALPQHTHPVDQRIPTGQPSPASITLTINGQGLSSGAKTTGSRDAGGAFTSSFIVDDIGPTLDAFAPGTEVPLQFTAGTNAGNPYGVGWIQVTITAVEELGGLVAKGVVVG